MSRVLGCFFVLGNCVILYGCIFYAKLECLMTKSYRFLCLGMVLLLITVGILIFLQRSSHVDDAMLITSMTIDVETQALRPLAIHSLENLASVHSAVPTGHTGLRLSVRYNRDEMLCGSRWR